MEYLLFKGIRKPLDYFIDSMIIELKKANIGYFVIDIDNFSNKKEEMLRFINGKNSNEVAAVMFNNIGLSLIMSSSELYLKELGIKVFNILVDHPLNYIDIFKFDMPNMTVLTIDRKHAEFIHKYISNDINVGFLPHGGTEIIEEEIPYDKREIDILYIGTNQKDFLCWENDLDKSGIDFRMIFSGLSLFMANNPQYALEEAFEKWREEQGLMYTQEELLYIFKKIVFIEQYIRCQYKKRTMYALAKKGLKIHIYGNGWEAIKERHPENIYTHGVITPEECLHRIRNSKIVLNCMPWFKDGSHERIYNTMLNKSLCLTDTSRYLLTQFEHGRNIVFYSLNDLDGMAEDAAWLLKNPKIALDIIMAGYQTAKERDTWQHRMRMIIDETYEKGF